MALSDPQSVTISGTAVSLPRVSSGNDQSTYRSGDGAVKETFSTTYGRRTRHLFRLDHSKIAPDPFVATNNVPLNMACYVVVDVPVTGYTIAEQKAVVDGFVAQLNASTGALITKVLGGEN